MNPGDRVVAALVTGSVTAEEHGPLGFALNESQIPDGATVVELEGLKMTDGALEDQLIWGEGSVWVWHVDKAAWPTTDNPHGQIVETSGSTCRVSFDDDGPSLWLAQSLLTLE